MFKDTYEHLFTNTSTNTLYEHTFYENLLRTFLARMAADSHEFVARMGHKIADVGAGKRPMVSII